MMLLWLSFLFADERALQAKTNTVEASLKSEGTFVRALWMLQHYGTNQSTDPQRDGQLKGTLARALAKDGVLAQDELGEFMDSKTFQRLAGEDSRMDKMEIDRSLDALASPSRSALTAQAREHAAYLTTTFDRVEPGHREAVKKLADWIVAKYRPGERLEIIVVCTGNSRRSILGSSMGNLAAAYYGFSEIGFHSGGTDPTAFNPRTIAALREIGFKIEATGNEALRGELKTANPIYRVEWGTGMEMLEYSKHYGDSSNPQSQFAALMVCTEADAGCPVVQGASLRLSMPFLDPKTYDDGKYESVKYAERRDDIGRTLLSAFAQARRAIGTKWP